MFHAKNGVLPFPGTEMEYIRFGTGKRILVMLPGLGDGLRTMKGTALPMALMYRCFAKTHTVYAFSRKRDLPEGYTTREMAEDQIAAMDLLGIEKCDLFGVSMGGMIAQWMAIDHPERVDRLVLTVTSSMPYPLLVESVTEWVGCAKNNDHTALMDANLRRIYSPEYYRRNKWMIPLIGKLTKPASYDRFFVQADACLTHAAFLHLSRISCPTLVVGGERDNCLGGDPSRDIAGEIPGAVLKMYPQWGHGLYEEEKGFNSLILDFFCA